MKRSSCISDFARYTLMSVLGTLGVSCYILADTFFVSKGLGAHGLAALNLAIPVYNFIHGVGLMLGIGGATKFSVCRGRKDSKAVNSIYTHTLYLAALFSVAFLLLGLFGSRQLALLLGADEAVAEMTGTYLRWLLLFSPAFIMNDVLLCFVRNDDHPRLAMAAMLVGSFSNIVLDYIFIFPMQMGIFGAVFATGLSPVISMVMMIPHWTKKRNTFHFAKTRPRMQIVRWHFSLGFPSLIAQASSGIVMIVFNTIILRLEGNTGVAAYGIIANLSLVVVAIHTGISQGVQPLISRFYGEGDARQAQAVLREAMMTMLALSCAVYLWILAFTQPIVAAFNAQSHERLRTMAMTGLRLYFISTPFVGFNIILATYFTSIERTLPAHALSAIRGLVLIIPAAVGLSLLWGMTGVWLAYPITESIVMGLGLVIYRKMARRGLDS